MASINSLLYRGYYYDSELGLYYLQSRYYNPQTRRFINADEPELILDLTKESVLGGNLYAYCENNAVNESDPSGEYSKSSLKKESWVARAVLKYIPSISRSKTLKTIWRTPKWLGVYFEVSVGVTIQSNPKCILGFGFSKGSFDVGISFGSGKTAVAFAKGITRSESYIQMSVLFSPKTMHAYMSVNFKIGIKHWFVVGVALVCALVPALSTIASSVVRALSSSIRIARPLLISALPHLLHV